VRFYDAHNHLQDERFGGRQAELVAVAARVGVARMVVNGSCEKDWPQVAALAEQFPEVLPSFGYHPWYLRERTAHWQESLVEFFDRKRSAVGEIGLDRWKPGLPYEGQEEAFVWQLRLAAERNLAASIHCLQAWGRLHELLRDNPRPARGFLLHSYGGSKEMVEPLAKLGALFSFPGYFMHARKHRQHEAFAAVPLDRLLIETDAPDQLLPDGDNRFPLRDGAGKPLNHPANLARIYEFMAEQRGMKVEILAEHIEENFRRVFGEFVR
jgi:TatD DNase family protein